MAGITTTRERGSFEAGAVVTTVGLAFMWQLFRHACVLAALPVPVARTPWGPTVWMLLYYALICLFALAAYRLPNHACACSSKALVFVCGATSLALALGTFLPADLPDPAVALARGLTVAGTACSAVLLAGHGLHALLNQAQNGPEAVMACSFASAFMSIVVTFVLGDILALNSFTAMASLIMAAVCFSLANRFGPGSGRRPTVPTPARDRMARVLALLVAATLAKAFLDTAAGPIGEQGRMVKHIVGIVEVAGFMLLSFIYADTRRFTVLASYVLLCSLVLGVALVAVGSGSVMLAGIATVVSARVLGESAMLALCALYCTSRSSDPFKTCCLALLIPEMAACLAGYGLGALLPTGGGASELLTHVSVAFMASVSLSAFLSSMRRELAIEKARHDLPGSASEPGDGELVSTDPLEALAVRFALTPRETDIARHLLAGHSAKRISELECLSINTVQTHSRTLYRKLGIHSRQELDGLVAEESSRQNRCG